MHYDILIIVELHGLLPFFLSFPLLGTALIHVLCGLISQSILPVTEVYE